MQVFLDFFYIFYWQELSVVVIMYLLLCYGALAQLARATGSYPVGRVFESHRRYQFKKILTFWLVFLLFVSIKKQDIISIILICIYIYLYTVWIVIYFLSNVSGLLFTLDIKCGIIANLSHFFLSSLYTIPNAFTSANG